MRLFEPALERHDHRATSTPRDGTFPRAEEIERKDGDELKS